MFLMCWPNTATSDEMIQARQNSKQQHSYSNDIHAKIVNSNIHIAMTGADPGGGGGGQGAFGEKQGGQKPHTQKKKDQNRTTTKQDTG